MRAALLALLLLLLAGCARTVSGVTALSVDMQQGIGGLIGVPGGGAHPRLDEAWAAFHATDAMFEALLAWPPYRWDTAAEDLTRRQEAGRALEESLQVVLEIGAAEPGIAALVRLGRAYEAQESWLSAPPVVPHRYTTAGYRTFFPVIRLLRPGAPPPWHPTPEPWLGSSGCPPASPPRARAVAAYRLAVQQAWSLDLHHQPEVRYALARLRALDPEGVERVP